MSQIVNRAQKAVTKVQLFRNTYALSLTLSATAFASDCQKTLVQVVDEIPGNWKFAKGMVSPPKGDSNLYLGFYLRHAYMVFDGIRIDGAPVRFAHPKMNGRNILSEDGVVFEVEIKSAELAARLKDAMGKKRFGISCADTVCRVLDEAKVETLVSRFGQIFPSAVLASLKNKGLTSDGELLNLRIFKLGQLDVDELRWLSLPEELFTTGAFLGVLSFGVYSVTLMWNG
jgi:hypothetical protein